MSRRRLVRVAAGAIFLLAGLALAADEAAVPPLKARVTDLTGTLTAAQIQTLEGRLRDFERGKGSQIAVLILPSTQPESIEQYSIRVADAWKIGRAKADDGVILVVAKNDRKLRIEVGRGLEGAIPDAIAKRVVSDVIAPHFRADDFYGGNAAAAGTAGRRKQILAGLSIALGDVAGAGDNRGRFSVADPGPWSWGRGDRCARGIGRLGDRRHCPGRSHRGCRGVPVCFIGRSRRPRTRRLLRRLGRRGGRLGVRRRRLRRLQRRRRGLQRRRSIGKLVREP